MLRGKSVFGHHYEFSSAFKNSFFFFAIHLDWNAELV